MPTVFNATKWACSKQIPASRDQIPGYLYDIIGQAMERHKKIEYPRVGGYSCSRKRDLSVD